MHSLISRLRRPASAGKLRQLRVTVYSRDQCGCCLKALDLLRVYQRRHEFVIEEVDIDAHPDLAALYDTSVPVVAIDGKVRFKGAVNHVLLERLLAAEEGRR